MDENRGAQSLQECLKHSLLQETMCDVKFHINKDGETATIMAHKFILIVRSPVFEAMFSGNFAEANNIVEIDDASEDDFRNLLGYLYHDEVNLTLENVDSMINLAKKYLLDALQTKCWTFIGQNLNDDNIYDYINIVGFHENEDVLDQCFAYAWSRPHEFIQHDSFTQLSYDLLFRFIKAERIIEVNDLTLFNGVLKWAATRVAEDKAKTTRGVLGEIFGKINFLAWNVEEFTSVVKDTDILTGDEKWKIHCYLKYKESTKEIEQLGISLVTSPQQLLVLQPGKQPDTVQEKWISMMQISSTSNLIITGLTVCGDKPGQMSSIKIRLKSYHGIDWCTSHSFIPRNDNTFYRITFDKPLEFIKPPITLSRNAFGVSVFGTSQIGFENLEIEVCSSNIRCFDVEKEKKYNIDGNEITVKWMAKMGNIIALFFYNQN